MTIADEHYQLKIGIRSTDTIPLVTLEGECDGFTAPFVHGAISALIGEGYRRIVVNLEDLKFIDVAGFHAIDECCLKMSGVGGEIFLVSPTKPVEEIYNILRERESCKILKTIDQAMARLKKL